MTGRLKVRVAVALVAAAVATAWGQGQVHAGAGAAEEPAQAPVFAHYYIWFNATSWDRAKSDIPLLGRYSSDEPTVMRRHIEMAKSAGIGGFIVSWKDTEVLNRRLDRLVALATEENFALALTYQALDFSRKPLPASDIGAGLDTFIARWGSSAPFRSSGKPSVIWTGTEQYPLGDLQAVTASRRTHLTLLASAKSVEDYERVAPAFDGNAYYWSSVDPESYTTYGSKLVAMGEAVHRSGGLWWSPAAPGFDARLLGGKRAVDRGDGGTFRSQLRTAAASSPDVIAIISWNEFSENTHIEPSTRYGTQALEVLAVAQGIDEPPSSDFGSDGSGHRAVVSVPAAVPLGALVALVLGSLVVVQHRNRMATRRRGRTSAPEEEGST